MTARHIHYPPISGKTFCLPSERLPLSWVKKEIDRPIYYHTRLPLSQIHWVYWADIPHDFSFPQIYQHYLSALPGGFLLRGCSREIARYLSEQGCEVLPIGSEAVIDLNDDILQKKSLQELVRRGMRWGAVEEIDRSRETLRKFETFHHHTRHSREPQLRFLFRDRFEPHERCFVFSTPENRWLGSIVLSRMNPGFMHTELILRSPGAPVGIMEALLVSMAKCLKAEGCSWLSLGEVPFYHHETPSNWKSRSINGAGRMLKFAYNYRGLFHFKNKFSPHWQPVYLCAKPRLTLPMMLDLFIQTRYIKLAEYKLFATLFPFADD